MILVIFRVMALSLLRDRAGLALAFLLPPVVFLVFAMVFAGGAGGRLDVRAGVYDSAGSADSRTLVDDLRSRLDGRLALFASEGALREAIDAGSVDAGLILRGDPATVPAPALILIHPGRKAAGEVLAAKVQASALQRLGARRQVRQAELLSALLSLSPAQRRTLSAASARPPPPFAAMEILPGGDPITIYYAGAVSILFLMFAAAQNSMSLIDERRAGLRLRLALSAEGLAPILLGRQLWLTVFGFLQGLALFSVGAVVFGAPLVASFAPWAATALLAAAASGALGLALAAACDTREQAQTASTFVILILAAVGGSMAPRFLMPAFLQDLGWLTPHAWVIETYQTILWRRTVNGSVYEGWLALAGFTLAGLLLALALERRRRL